MNLFCENVGREDARSRRVAAALVLLGGIIALPAIADRVAWLPLVAGIVLVVVGLGYVARGLVGHGTWLFGAVTLVLGVADWLLARGGHGIWGLILGIVFAVAGFATAAAGRCPINTLLHVDTRTPPRTAGGRAPMQVPQHH